jgi:hypothetical protein
MDGGLSALQRAILIAAYKNRGSITTVEKKPRPYADLYLWEIRREYFGFQSSQEWLQAKNRNSVKASISRAVSRLITRGLVSKKILWGHSCLRLTGRGIELSKELGTKIQVNR